MRGCVARAAWRAGRTALTAATICTGVAMEPATATARVGVGCGVTPRGEIGETGVAAAFARVICTTPAAAGRGSAGRVALAVGEGDGIGCATIVVGEDTAVGGGALVAVACGALVAVGCIAGSIAVSGVVEDAGWDVTAG